jgi:hypothetical protein
MLRKWAYGLVICGFSALACSSSDAPSGAAGSTGAGGTSVAQDASATDSPSLSDGKVETGPTCNLPSALGPVARSSDGILTNHPSFHFAKTGGNLEVTTAYFELTRLGDFNSLVALGDVRNPTATQQCAPYVDQFAVGMLGVVTVIDGAAYEFPGSQFSVICLDPGGTAAFRSIQNDNVPDTALDGDLTISYSFTGFSMVPPNRRHPSEPRIVSAAVEADDAMGWRLRGQMKSGSIDIHNFESHVFIRDPSGLLYNDFRLMPGGFGTIAAGSVLDFETPSNRADFCSYELYDRFGEGAQPPEPDAGTDAAGD